MTDYIEGIDIYEGNGRIVPSKIFDAGKQFIVHKLTDGIGSPDTRALYNLTAAQNEIDANDVQAVLGVYHFLRVRHGRPQDARDQAKEFVAKMKALGVPIQFMWYDVEFESLTDYKLGEQRGIAKDILLAGKDPVAMGQVRAEVREAILSFRDQYTIEVNCTGWPQTRIAYGDKGDWDLMGVTSIDELKDDLLALAKFTTDPTPPNPPHPFTKVTFWQYAADEGNIGTCPGVPSEHCDLDHFLGSFDDILAMP